MNIFLKADYKTHTAFCPAYSPGGRLTSIEMLTHYTHVGTSAAMPQEVLTPLLNDRQRVLLLQEQINIIEKHYDFFCDHDLRVAINLDKPLAECLLDCDSVLNKMSQYDCLELNVSENFPDLISGRNNGLLRALSEKFNLSLNNYGAGKATSKAVFDDLFYRIKLDKGFIQHHIKRSSFHPFINTILEHISPHCQAIDVQGVDDIIGLNTVRNYAFDGIQSALFPPVNEDALIHLTEPPYPLREHILQ